jgi:hypothetical protein
MKCTIDKTISGTPEKKYYLINYLIQELENMLGREVQIYLLIDKKQREDFFKLPSYSLPNFSAPNTGNSSVGIPRFGFFNFFTSNVGTTTSNVSQQIMYDPEEVRIPYKYFHNYFESLFRLNKNKEFQEEKDKKFSFKMSGGNYENEEQTTEESTIEENNINIKKFLFYNMISDLKIRIEL